MTDDPATRDAPVGYARTTPPAANAVYRWYVGPVDDPDRFELVGVGISGGEGTTWQARYRGQLAAPLIRAVKQLRMPMDAGPGWPTRADMLRLEDQKALLHQLRSEHLVGVYDVFLGPAPHPLGGADPNGALLPYVEMEWITGETLAQHTGGWPATANTLPERLGYLADLADAVQMMHSHTHAAGNPMLHRDIKPANCLIEPTRGLVLVDVNTIRPIHDGHDPDGRHTPSYTAPEVLLDPWSPRSPASDVFSMGAVGLFAVTGEDPPLGLDRADVRLGLRSRVRTVARRAGAKTPSRFADDLLAALDPDPGRRPTDVVRWVEGLRRSAGVGGRARLRRALVAALAVVLVAAAVPLAWYVANGGDDGARTPAASDELSQSTSPASSPSPSQSSPAPSSASASTPASPSQSAPSQVPPPSGSSSSSQAPPPGGDPVTTPVGTIAFPAAGAEVPRCVYLTGTSRLPADHTLVLVVRNLSNSDPNEYLQTVFDWETVATRSSWRGAQFFGGEDDSVGQSYRIELHAVTIAQVQVAQSQNDGSSWDQPKGAAFGRVLAALTVERTAGDGDFPCHPDGD